MRITLLAALFSLASPAGAQDLYDPTILRNVDLQFEDANWWVLLQQNYASQTNILADMTVEGIVYPDVGVRIRGNTSFIALPSGSQKVSLNVSVDFVNEDQELMGHNTLNFNNAFTDPTFCREVVYQNIISEWIPGGRANHVTVSLNGENWGVYANVQQYGKEVLGEYFEDNDGLRLKCANNPFGPGLQYAGTNPSSYSGYEVKNDGGFSDPIAELIAVCEAIDNTPPVNWQDADSVFAIDPSIWTVVVENLFSDDDSYVNKGCDFVLYQNPVDGRMHLHQTDGNESWTEDDWTATQGFLSGNKPFLSNLLSNPYLRGRYMAHFREVLNAELDWTVLQPRFDAHRALIDAAVQNDSKKIYSYSAFVNNFTTTVDLGVSGPFGGNRIGIQEYVNQRRALLLADAEVAATGPSISSVSAGPSVPGEPSFITATVSAVDPLLGVEAWYQADPSAPFERITMLDDGLGGDGIAGDGIFGVELPFLGQGGQQVRYYVGAASQAPFSPQSFEPILAENAPLILTFQGGDVASDVLINEFMASNDSTLADEAGDFEDYVELYNRGSEAIDLSGMYMSDSLLTPTEWQIPAGTILAPGQALLLWADEDLDEGPNHADFKLSTSGEEVGLWDVDGTTLLDSIVFGAQQADVSTGRLTDGGGLWVTFPDPTPGTLNSDGCGLRRYDQLDPLGHGLELLAGGSGAIGTTISLNASGFLPASLATLGFGTAPGHAPLSGTSIVVLLSAPYTLIGLPVDGGGLMSLPFDLPNEPVLIGVEFFCQIAGLDPLGQENATNAVALNICP